MLYLSPKLVDYLSVQVDKTCSLSLSKARGLSLRAGGQNMLYLSPKLVDYLSIQVDKTCSISLQSSWIISPYRWTKTLYLPQSSWIISPYRWTKHALSLSKARGLSLRTGGQNMLYLSPTLVGYLSVQMDKHALSLSNARGLSLRTDGQNMLYLSPKLVDYLSVQVDKTCSISLQSSWIISPYRWTNYALSLAKPRGLSLCTCRQLSLLFFFRDFFHFVSCVTNEFSKLRVWCGGLEQFVYDNLKTELGVSSVLPTYYYELEFCAGTHFYIIYYTLVYTGQGR